MLELAADLGNNISLMKRTTLIFTVLIAFSLMSFSLFSGRKERQQKELDKIAALADEGKIDDAISGYLAFANDNPKSELLGRVYLSLADLYLQKNDLERAVSAFKRVSEVSRNAKEKSQAAVSIARIYFGQKKFIETIDSLRGQFESSRDLAARAEIASLLFQSCRELEKYFQTVYWLGQYSAAAQGPEVEKARMLAVDLVAKLSDQEIEQELRSEGPDWLKNELSYQLARRYFESNRDDEAKGILENMLRKYRDPNRRQEAGELLRMVDKMNKVAPDRIGLILPLSGPFQNLGERALKGALMAARIFKAPDSPAQVELRVADADLDPQTATEAVKKMVAEDNIIALVGPITNQNALAVADQSLQLRLPMIALSPAAELSGKGSFVFRNCLTKQSQIQALLDWAVKKKQLLKFVILYPEDKYGNEFAQLFEAELKTGGGTVVKKIPYPAEQTDFRDQVKTLTEKGIEFDAIFIPDSWEKVDLIVPQILYFKIKTQLLGASGWHNQKIFEQINPSYLEGAVLVDLYAPEAKSRPFTDYEFNYQQLFQETPSLIDAQAYEAVSMLIDLIQQNNINTRKALADAIAETRNWTGPLGTANVTPAGDIQHELTLFQIQKGAFVPIR